MQVSIYKKKNQQPSKASDLEELLWALHYFTEVIPFLKSRVLGTAPQL